MHKYHVTEATTLNIKLKCLHWT